MWKGRCRAARCRGLAGRCNEEYFFTADGTLANPSFLDYRMPTPVDVPMIETVIVEVPNPRHPFGLRGVGEAPDHPAVSGPGQRHLSGGWRPHGPAAHVSRRHPGSPAEQAAPPVNQGAASWLSQSRWTGTKVLCSAWICRSGASTTWRALHKESSSGRRQRLCRGPDRLLPRRMCGLRDARYFPTLRKSATRSPIIIVVALVLARMQSGMIEASAIRRFSSPCTRPCWSTTAMGSEAGPILQVPQM